MPAFATLDPRPTGWFAVARTSELARGRELEGVLATLPYRLRRHADASLALSLGGRPGEVVEQNGFVLAWHHPRGEAPTWRVPVLDEHDFAPLRHHVLHARTHPQEVYENSIDTGHFPVIHGYSDIAVETPMQLDAHEMRVGYAIARRMPVPFLAAKPKVVAHFEVHLHGLGCAHNHIHLPAFGLHVRMFALATPTTPGQVTIRLASSVARASKLPLFGLYRPLVHTGVMSSIVADFQQDIAIWERKVFLRPPLLVKGDGPIEAFRRWARQFYASSPAHAEAA